MIISSIQNHPSIQAYAVLFDTGSTHTYINRAKLPAGVVPLQLPQTEYPSTAAGPFRVSSCVNLTSLTFPEFSKSLRVDHLQARIFDAPDSQYDVILGRDFMNQVGLDCCHSDHTMRWHDRVVPMKD